MQELNFLINSMENGGAERALLTLMQGFLAKNYKVTLLLLEDENSYQLPKEIKIINLGKAGKSSLAKFSSLITLAFKVKKLKLQAISSHSFRANYVNVLAKIFGSKHKAFITIHSEKSIYEDGTFSSKLNLFLINSLYKKADKVIFVSKSSQKSFNFPFPSQVIYNGFDLEKIQKEAQEACDFDFKQEKTYLLCLNRLITLKRVNDIISALAFLEEKYELIIIGDGRERKNLENLAKKLNLEKRTHFLGELSHPFPFMKQAQIFILASQSEAFGNVLIEAMINKILILSSNFPAAKEILEDKYGFLFQVGNIESLVKTIKNIANKDEITEQAYERAKDFSLEKTLQAYKDLFKEVG